MEIKADTFVPHRRFVTVKKAEEWWIEKSRENPEFFIHYCLHLAPVAHHKMWLNLFFNPLYTLVNIVAPRESAKTTISIYAIAWIIGTFPDLTNGVICSSSDQAEGRIAELRYLIEHNPAFSNVFPNIKIDYRRKATTKRFSVVDVSIPYNIWVAFHVRAIKDPTMIGLGSGGAGILGQRISGVLLLDDIVDESDLSVAMQDKKERYIINTLMPCIQEGARLWNIGTRWMSDDIYERFANNPAWKSLVIPAIIQDDNGKQYSYWPEHWPLKKLEAKRIAMNNDVLFGIMYLCKAADATLGLFSIELFDSCVADLSKMKKELVFQSFFITSDFATSMHTKADWNVLYACGITQEDKVIVLDGMRYKLPAEANIDVVIDFVYRTTDSWDHTVTAVLVENVAFQSIFANFINEKSAFMPVQKVVPIGKKQERATPIRDYMILGRFFISDKLPFLDIMRNEFTTLGFSRYEDTVDPLSLLLQYLSRTNIKARMRCIKDPFKI